MVNTNSNEIKASVVKDEWGRSVGAETRPGEYGLFQLLTSLPIVSKLLKGGRSVQIQVDDQGKPTSVSSK